MSQRGKLVGNNRSNLGVPAGWSHQDRRFGESLKQNLDVLVGQRGDKLDRAVTFRDLLDSGIVVLASGITNFDGDASAIGLTQLVPNLDIPPAPTNLTANGAFQNIIIGFDLKLYQGHSYVELWRNTTDSIATATLSAQISGFTGTYADPVGSGSTFYYWVRAVNQNGIFGPYNSSAGTLGQTAPDVQLLLDTLNGAITSSELAISLSTPIAAIPGIQTSLGSINSDLSGINTDISGINTDISGINTDISTLSSNVNTITTTLASTVSTSSLTTALGSYTTTTSLESNYYTLNEADSAIQAAVLGLASTTQLNTALGSYTSTADLTNNYYTKTSADSAIAAQINTYNTNTIGPTYTSTADLTQNYYTKTSADSAISAAITFYNTNTIGANYTNSADLVQNHYTKTTADSAISAAITTYNTNTIGANYTSTADLTQNYYTKTGADSAISAAITTYNTDTIGANYTSTAALTQNYYTKTSADSAISTAITNYNSNTIGANYSTTADIAQNYYTKTEADTAYASTEDILNAQVDDPDGGSNQVTLAQAMSTQADVNGDLKGQYTVKIDANGAVAGFGLASTTTSLGANESEFYINADRFALMRGGSDTSAAVTPFTVQATATTINGIAVPAGVYMDAAFIKTASITSAQIGSLNADVINAGFIDAAHIQASTIDASKLILDGATMTSQVINGIPTLQVNELNANVLSTGTLNTSRINLDGATITANASGQVQIKDLGVDTLQIKGQAVTIPTSAYSTGEINNTIAQTVTWTSTGAPTFVAASWTQDGLGNTGDYGGTVQIKYGSAVLWTQSYTGQQNARKQQQAVNISFTPSVGSATVTLVGINTDGTYKMSNRSLFALETKK